MKFDMERLKRKSEEDYEKAWQESRDLIKKEGKLFSLEDKGTSHPLFDLVQELRKIMTDLGFREIVVPAIIEKDEIRKQYGPEAPIILDRIFFLAGLDRPDLGISRENMEKLREKIPEFEQFDGLKKIFRRYKKGKISSDELAEIMVKELDLEEEEASTILSTFEDFRKLEPIPSNLTLRSHTTAGWFPVLGKMQIREPLPIQLFTVGPKYRREQKLDETHLYRSWTGSLVVMTEEISREDGKDLAEKILKELGFEKIEFRTKSATSKYYVPESEFEIYVKHAETGEMIEVGNGGFYNPISLANYEIPHPVFNLGIGLERILMIRTGEEDIRRLVYPYRYKKLDLSDEQISQMLKLKEEPKTEAGRQLAEMIVKTAKNYKDEPSPCEFQIFEGKINGVNISVKIIEPEEDTKLIGPAAFNQIYVKDGNVIGVPPGGWEADKSMGEIRDHGHYTGISYIEAFADLAAREIEKSIEEGKEKTKIKVQIVKSLGDINLYLKRPAHRYITDNKKRIDIRGPVFTTIIAKIEQ